MSCLAVDSLMLSARGLSSGDVYQAIGCSRQKLGQDVGPEDKGVGNVYTWKVYMEIPKARKSVRRAVS